MDHLLTIITFVPLVGALLILALPQGAAQPDPMGCGGRHAAADPHRDLPLRAFRHRHHRGPVRREVSWVPSYNITYFIGVDGISISMVLLTALICFIAVFASFGIDKGVKGYFALLLMLDTGMMGVFVSLDFFLFYIFWEVMLLPMYFLIGIWGGPRREYAAIKFFLYTLLGSVLILLAMLGLYYYNPTPTFDMTKLAANASGY